MNGKLRAVADEWLDAGAEIVSTATYQVTLEGLQREFGMSADEARARVRDSCEQLRESIAAHGGQRRQRQQQQQQRRAKVALSLGPLSAVLPGCDEFTARYPADVTPARLIEFHRARTRELQLASGAGGGAGVDVVAFETVGDATEAVSIGRVMGDSHLGAVPFWLSLQCRDAAHLASGESLVRAIPDVLRACEREKGQGPNLVALGVNCVHVALLPSLVPRIDACVRNFMHESAAHPWRVDVVAYSNSGEVWAQGSGWVWPSSHQPEREGAERGGREGQAREPNSLASASWAGVVASCGARIIGGCCRIGSQHIAALREKVLAPQKSTLQIS